MKNRVEIEGYVTNRIWQWSEPGRSLPDTLFRLACYVDGDEQWVEHEPRPRPFYMTVRVRGSVLNGVPVGVQPEQRVFVTGQLVSRDYTHSLADFLARVKDMPELPLPEGFDPQRTVELRSLNEVVAESIRVVEEEQDNGNGKDDHRKSRRQRRRERKQAVEVSTYPSPLAVGEHVTRSPDSGTLPVNTNSSTAIVR